MGRDVKLPSQVIGKEDTTTGDFKLGSETTIPTMMAELGKWFENVQETLAQLDYHIAYIRKSEWVALKILSCAHSDLLRFYFQERTTRALRSPNQTKLIDFYLRRAMVAAIFYQEAAKITIRIPAMRAFITLEDSMTNP